MSYPLSKRLQLYGFALDAIILFPVFALIARIRARRRTGPLRVLIVPILTRVGDLVCSTPVFREIKIRHPNTRLAVVVGRKAKGILTNNPRIDELIDYNDERFHGWFGRAYFFYFLYIRRFDAVLSLGSSVVGTLAGVFAAAPVRAKVTVAKPPVLERTTDCLNTHRFRYADGSFLPRHYLSLLSAIGIDASAAPIIKEVFPTEAGSTKARAFLTNAFGGAPPFVVGITVSAGNSIKEWPLPRFASVADALVEQYGAKIIFIDSPANRARAAETARLMRHGELAAIAVGFSLEELPSLIKQLHAFIAVDTGAIYIAHALGVPLIDIIGPVHPDEQPPQDELSIQVRPAPGIAPTSFVLAWQTRNGNHAEAVLSITVPQVLAAFAVLLSRGFVPVPRQPHGPHS